MTPGDKWNQRHEAAAGQPPADPAPVVIRAAGLLEAEANRPRRALDLACGLGRNARFLAARGWHVVAVDVSRVAIDKLSGVDNIDARVLDLEFARLPEGPFDLVIDTLYLQRDLFPEVRRVLAPGGLFAAEIPVAGHSTVNPAYTLPAGELAHEFHHWEILHAAGPELIARKPG